MSLIGISGKIGSGKDTLAGLLHYLSYFTKWPGTVNDDLESDDWILHMVKEGPLVSGMETRRFADTLKDIVCMLIGCTRQQLEDRVFKEQELSNEWDCLVRTSSYGAPDELVPMDYPGVEAHIHRRKMTPRLLMQLIGTDCGRRIIHPNIWTNALFANYRPLDPAKSVSMLSAIDYSTCKFPQWIIPDVRFPNEAKAIKDRGGIVIRINRSSNNSSTHESETSLDNYENFDIVIDNNGTLKDLYNVALNIIHKIKQ